MKKRYVNQRDMIFIIVFIGLFIFQWYRASFGEGINDEHFYISLGYRFACGDAILVDDWHIAQLTGYILMPFVKLYLWFNHSTDGIVLWFRHLYVVLHGLTTCCFYIRYSNQSKWCTIAAFIFFMFSPLGIMNLSYNTMGIDFMMLSICCYGLNHNKPWLNIFSGFLFSLAVLCNPYLVFLYIGVIFYVVYQRVKNKQHTLVKPFGYSFLGIVFSALLFVGFVFSRATLQQVFESLPHLIDPSHQTSILDSLLRLGYQSWQSFGVLLIIQCVVLVVYWFNQPKRPLLLRFEVILVVISWIYLLVISKYRLSIGGYACVYLPYLVYCLMACSGQNHHKTKLEVALVITLLHAILVGFSSNIGIRAVANISIGAVAFATLLLDETDPFLSKANALMVISLLLVTIGSKVYYGYGEPNVMSQDHLIGNGPLQGLNCDETFYDHYQHTYQQIQTIDTDGSTSNVILISDESWPFLALDKAIYNYSTYIYLYTKAEYLTEMEAYLKLHPTNDFHIYIFSNRFDITPNDLSFTSSAQITVMD